MDTETHQPKAVLAKLQAHREKRAGDDIFTLPDTGIEVTMPRFRPYDAWQKAQQRGGKSTGGMQVHYIVSICLFDGERLTANDYRELIPADDHIKIMGRVFGGSSDDEDGEDGEGNEDA